MTKRISPKVTLVFGVLSSSTSSIFARYSSAPSLIISLYRLVWSVVLLFPTVLRGHLPEMRAVAKKDLAACSVSGIFLALHFFLWFESLHYTTITSATVIVSTEVIFAAIGFCIFLHGRIPPMAAVAIAITFSGMILTSLGGNTGGSSLWGNLLCLGAAVMSSGYTLIGRTMRLKMSTTIYTFLVYLSCTVALIVMCLATGTPMLGYAPKEFVISLFLCIFCTLMGHSIFSWALKFFTPAFVSASKLLGPVFAAILAFILFAEVPTFVEILGCSVILGGVWMYCRVEQAEAELDGTTVQPDV
ncbi:MAG: DMT family transporter [Angelakisella sp.]|nr:DMT family transporter [Angelakisella sp.]